MVSSIMHSNLCITCCRAANAGVKFITKYSKLILLTASQLSIANGSVPVPHPTIYVPCITTMQLTLPLCIIIMLSSLVDVSPPHT